MKITVLGSSSVGNSYIFEASDGVLVVEVGICLSEIKKALKWQINGIKGAICTHRHKDHSKYLCEFVQNGIPVLAVEDVFASVSFKGIKNLSLCKVVKPMHGYQVGGFKVLAFNVKHDVPCVGYIISHAEMGRLLFLTDTATCEYTFDKLDYMMIEANYSKSILLSNIEQGKVPLAMKSRLLHSHLELETTKQIIEANKNERLKKVILIHLSDTNSNEEEFIDDVQKSVGVATEVADAGRVFELYNF